MYAGFAVSRYSARESDLDVVCTGEAGVFGLARVVPVICLSDEGGGEGLFGDGGHFQQSLSTSRAVKDFYNLFRSARVFVTSTSAPPGFIYLMCLFT